MRIVIYLSIVSLALSGCASSGVNMYSVPAPSRRVCASNMNTKISYEPIHVEPIEYSRNISTPRQIEQKITRPTRKSKPAAQKRLHKNTLNEAMGVSYKLFKDGISYIKPKLKKIPGLGK